MTTSNWILWVTARPTDTSLPYRWRAPSRPILGLELRPEWTSHLHFCGMGHGDSEWWPACSHWDGWNRSVPDGLEWRMVMPDEGKDDIYWGGLDLLPCPFTGKPPKVSYLGRWIGAPPYCPEWLGIKSHMISSLGWTDAARMRDAWNTRSPKS